MSTVVASVPATPRPRPAEAKSSAGPLRRPSGHRSSQRHTSWAVAFVAVAAGCARLPAGDVRAITPVPVQGRVVLVRGFLDWYSTGMDGLTEQLRAQGMDAVVFREEQWGEAANALVENPAGGPLVLIGFSYGADDVLKIASLLNVDSQPVSLVVTIDPVTPGPVPANVKRCVNFYQPNGIWDVFPWLRGVPLSAEGRTTPLENINVRSRPDLTESDTSHATIASNEKIHRAVTDLVRRCLKLSPAATSPGR